MKTYQYLLHGLDCANCAAKIEQAVSKIDGIKTSHVDFISKQLTVTADQKRDDKIKDVVSSIESGVQVVEKSSAQSGNEQKSKQKYKDFIEIPLAVIFFSIGILLNRLDVPLWGPAIFYAFSVLIIGYEIFIKGIKSLLRFKLDENTLMTIAVIAAFFLGEFIESALVVLLFRIGAIFESKAVENSRRDIKRLAQIRPDSALLITHGETKTVPAETVSVGDIILIKPFERIPLDGIVLDGTSSLDASAITGESLPIECIKETQVLSGMMNGQGALKVRVTKSFSDSTATRILAMVESAATKKAETERTITRFARIYTPIVLSLSVLLTVLPPLFGFGEINVWFSRTLVFLVASCPCAFVIAVPLGFYSGIGAASKLGVLVKGGRYVEILAKANTVVFDKTGTLTTGSLSVSEVTSFGSYSEQELLRIAAACEQYSEHPAARAIKNAASGKELPTLSNIREIPGLGIRASANQGEILLGQKKLFSQMGQTIDSLPPASVYLSINGHIEGSFSVTDTIRSDSKKTVDELRQLGVKRLVMLSGDNKSAAKKVAESCGLDQYYAELMPEDKVAMMQKLRPKHGSILFVGDGINDAPVLASSDCGVAMGLGTSAAIESADVILTNDKPSKLPTAIHLFRRTMSVVRFNIVFALVVKAIILILAAVGIAPMWLAVFADTGVSALSVINATRLLQIKQNKSI